MEEYFGPNMNLADFKNRRRHVTKILNILWPSPSTQRNWDGGNCQRFLNYLTSTMRNQVLYARWVLVLQALEKGQILNDHFPKYVKKEKPHVDTEVREFFGNFARFDLSKSTNRRAKFLEFLRSLANRDPPTDAHSDGLALLTVPQINPPTDDCKITPAQARDLLALPAPVQTVEEMPPAINGSLNLDDWKITSRPTVGDYYTPTGSFNEPICNHASSSLLEPPIPPEGYQYDPSWSDIPYSSSSSRHSHQDQYNQQLEQRLLTMMNQPHQ